MTKVVYNACYGGFSLSEAGVAHYAQLAGLTLYPEPSRYGSIVSPTYWLVPLDQRPAAIDWPTASQAERAAHSAAYRAAVLNDRDISRTDPHLVATVEALGDAANGRCAELAIAEIPAGSRYRIDEYDGLEAVMTPDDYEWSIA